MAVQNFIQYFGLLFLLWNARGIQANLLEFQNFVFKKKPQVICITETWLRPSVRFQLKGYTVFRGDRFPDGGGGGGIAILVHNSLPAVENTTAMFPGGQMEVLSAKFKLKRGWVDVFTFYNPCLSIRSEEFDFYFAKGSRNSIFCGDLNAHHSLWSPDNRCRGNTTGRNLFDSLSENVGLSLLTPKGLRTYTDRWGNDSTLDLCFGTGSLCCVDEVFQCDPIGGDHYPVIYGFSSVVLHNSQSVMKWNLKEVNWAEWGKVMVKKWNEGAIKWNSLSDFVDCIVHFTKDFAKLKSSNFNSKVHKAFWSEECSRAVALRRRARRIFRNHPSLENRINLNRATASSRRVLKLARRRSWQEFCSTLDFSVNENLIWKVFRSMQGRSSPLIYPIVSGDGEMLSDLEIARKFADSFALQFQTRGKIQNEGFCRSIVSANCSVSADHPMNSLFLLSELRMAIGSVNTKSATGLDFFHNQFLSNLPSPLHQSLLDLVNDAWVRGLFHSDFKMSVLVPLPKPGKDPSVVSSYRPIALLSCLGKLFERLVHQRLYWYLEYKHHIPLEQAGFRKGHSCLDSLLYLEKHIQIALRSQQILIIVFFDIEKAFDSANHTAILYKLSTMGVKGRMFRWFQDFFSGRLFNVRVGSVYSEPRDILNGVPQGSILSPLLFSCLLSDIPSFDGVHKILYADDLSLFAMGRDVDSVVNQMQVALNRLSLWLMEWGLVVNPAKSSTMFFTRKKITNLPRLVLDEVNIPLVTTHKFLGMYLDAPLLLWRRHIAYLRETCLNKLRIMRALAGSAWGCDRKSLLTFYCSYIRSRLSYGIEVYSSASASLLSTLEVVQNHALRIVTGLGRGTPIPILQLEAGTCSLQAFFNTRDLIMLRKVQGLVFCHRTFQALACPSVFNLNWITYPHKAPFVVRMQSLCTMVGVNFGRFCYLENVFIVPPWFSLSDRVQLDIVGMSSVNKNNIFNWLRYTVYSDHYSFYSDGSKSDQGVGSAVFIGDIGLSLSWRLHNDHSVMASELFAIFNALKWILDHMDHCKCVIFSDSRGALSLISCHNVSSYAFLISSIQLLVLYLNNREIEVCFQWVPAHCGIMGNEVADCLARNAVNYDEITHLEFEVKENISLVKRSVREWWLTRVGLNVTGTLFAGLVGDVRSWRWISTGCRIADVILAKLRSGCVGLNYYLHKIRASDSAFCPHCPGVLETVPHFIMECPYYERYRLILKRDVTDFGVDLVSLSVLLTGGGFKPNIRVKILRKTFIYIKNTGRLLADHS